MNALATVPVKAKTSSNLPVFDSHLPVLGKVDLNDPLEWLWVGGLAVDIFFVSGLTKWVIAAGLIAARYEVQKRCAK